MNQEKLGFYDNATEFDEPRENEKFFFFFFFVTVKHSRMVRLPEPGIKTGILETKTGSSGSSKKSAAAN